MTVQKLIESKGKFVSIVRSDVTVDDVVLLAIGTIVWWRHQNGTITVRCLHEDELIYQIVVADDGMGLPEGKGWPIAGKLGEKLSAAESGIEIVNVTRWIFYTPIRLGLTG